MGVENNPGCLVHPYSQGVDKENICHWPHLKTCRYGGTYAHLDIAYEFASWISGEFTLYIIKEFQRLRDEVHKQLGL